MDVVFLVVPSSSRLLCQMLHPTRVPFCARVFMAVILVVQHSLHLKSSRSLICEDHLTEHLLICPQTCKQNRVVVVLVVMANLHSLACDQGGSSGKCHTFNLNKRSWLRYEHGAG